MFYLIKGEYTLVGACTREIMQNPTSDLKKKKAGIENGNAVQVSVARIAKAKG